jgi:cold shock CspA family protein
MQLPPVITFRRLRGTNALDADIRTRLEQLERYAPGLMAARVLVEPAERHHRDGNRVHVRIDLTLPGGEVVVSHEASLRPTARALAAQRTWKSNEPDRAHTHAAFAVREAFAVARRRLQDRVRRRRGSVKVHVEQPRGRVIRLSPSRTHGFLEAADGHEVYFHKRSVLDDAFDDLEVGSLVTFVEERGEKGPQASTVRVLG